MVLVDTSVWIRFLAGMEPYASELDRLLARDEVLGHDFVYGELLIGDRGGRARMLVAYTELHWAALVRHVEVAGMVKDRRINGRGIGWIDAHLLASTMVERSSLWTADRPLANLAEDLGVAHQRLA